MNQAMPRPPLLRRLPPWASTVPMWCGAAMFAFMMFGVMTGPVPKAHPGTGPVQLVALGLVPQAGLAVAMALPIAFALRRPVLTLGLILAESAGYAAIGGKTWPLGGVAIVVVCYIAVNRPHRTSVAAAIVAPIVLLGEFAADGYGPNTQLSDYLSIGSGIALVFLVAWMIGHSIRQSRAYDTALRAHLSGRTVMAERLRIARELHDQVAHSMGIIALQSGAARRAVDVEPDGVREALGVIETTSRETLSGLRRMLGALRESDLAQVPAQPQPQRGPAPGLADIEQLVAATAGAGVRVDVRWRGERRPLPPEVDLSAFRIIQESVTNVVRHAGTGHCRVGVDFRDEELAVEIVDDGLGRADEGTGYGIAGMRERVDLLHGRFSAGPRLGGGFRVEALLPLRVGVLR